VHRDQQEVQLSHHDVGFSNATLQSHQSEVVADLQLPTKDTCHEVVVVLDMVHLHHVVSFQREVSAGLQHLHDEWHHLDEWHYHPFHVCDCERTMVILQVEDGQAAQHQTQEESLQMPDVHRSHQHAIHCCDQNLILMDDFLEPRRVEPDGDSVAVLMSPRLTPDT